MSFIYSIVQALILIVFLGVCVILLDYELRRAWSFIKKAWKTPSDAAEKKNSKPI